jgi:hypothetical protein
MNGEENDEGRKKRLTRRKKTREKKGGKEFWHGSTIRREEGEQKTDDSEKCLWLVLQESVQPVLKIQKRFHF